MTPRFITTAPAGLYRPGLIVDVIEITGTTAYDPAARDAHTSPAGDGQWLRVRHPNGILLGMFRGPAALTDALGVDLGSLAEVVRT